MQKILIIGGAAIAIYTFGYLGSVGIAWVLQWLINATFGTEFAYSVWLLGLLLYIVWLLLQPNKS